MAYKLRKAVIIIHGFGGCLDEHKNLADYLNNDFDVFTFWLPGHGKGIFNYPKKEDWIKASEEQVNMLYQKKYKEIYVIGHSLGGIIASYLAVKYSRIKKIVLEAPSYVFNFKSCFKSFKNYKKSYLFSHLIKFAPGVLKEFKDLIVEYKNICYEIKIPTLIIQGKDDVIVPFESSIDLYEKLPSRKKYLILVDDLPHAMFYSKRNNDIMEMTKKFLSDKKFNAEEYNAMLNRGT